MDLLDEYKLITNQYEDSLFNIIKKVIDDAKEEAFNCNMNPVDTFIYINDKLVRMYKQMLITQEIISDEKQYTKKLVSYVISEKLFERIESYMQPVISCTRKYIEEKANDLLDSTSLDELQEKHKFLMDLLSNKTIQDNSYLYEDIELTRFKLSL